MGAMDNELATLQRQSGTARSSGVENITREKQDKPA
jgi:hypothetical protein